MCVHTSMILKLVDLLVSSIMLIHLLLEPARVVHDTAVLNLVLEYGVCIWLSRFRSGSQAT
jgi:hypothetical protein